MTALQLVQPELRKRVEEIFTLHASDVWRALRSLGASESDADDLTQEVFLVVYRKLPEFEERSLISTWLYGISVRVFSDHRRRAHVRREQATGEIPEGRISASQIQEIEAQHAQQLLDSALATLDDDKRAVFVLYEIEGLQMKEVAAALDCPVQTAYSRLHTARAEVEARFRVALRPRSRSKRNEVES